VRSETNKTRTQRVYLRVEPKLKRAVLAYCKRHRTTMSQIVTGFFRTLLERERKRKEEENPEAEQF
jgi:hypothetical protein